MAVTKLNDKVWLDPVHITGVYESAGGVTIRFDVGDTLVIDGDASKTEEYVSKIHTAQERAGR